MDLRKGQRAVIKKTLCQQRLTNEISHEDYYRWINERGGVRFRGDTEKIRAALAAGDFHLNSVMSLAWWDVQIPQPISRKLANAFREAGDYATLAGLVCCAKQAARDAAAGEMR